MNYDEDIKDIMYKLYIKDHPPRPFYSGSELTWSYECFFLFGIHLDHYYKIVSRIKKLEKIKDGLLQIGQES